MDGVVVPGFMPRPFPEVHPQAPSFQLLRGHLIIFVARISGLRPKNLPLGRKPRANPVPRAKSSIICCCVEAGQVLKSKTTTCRTPGKKARAFSSWVSGVMFLKRNLWISKQFLVAAVYYISILYKYTI